MKNFEKFEFQSEKGKLEISGERKSELKEKEQEKSADIEKKKIKKKAEEEGIKEEETKEIERTGKELKKECYSKKERERYEKEKREEEKKIIDELINSGLPFVLRGSWAGEIISAIPSRHKDIDIYVERKNWDKVEKFLKEKNFEIEEVEKNKRIIRKGKVCLDCHLWEEKENQYIEETSYGTFYFPKEGFIQYPYKNSSIRIMSPELMWILKKGGPSLSSEHKKNLEKLLRFIDRKKLQEISNKFKYVPSTERRKED